MEERISIKARATYLFSSPFQQMIASTFGQYFDIPRPLSIWLKYVQIDCMIFFLMTFWLLVLACIGLPHSFCGGVRWCKLSKWILDNTQTTQSMMDCQSFPRLDYFETVWHSDTFSARCTIACHPDHRLVWVQIWIVHCYFLFAVGMHHFWSPCWPDTDRYNAWHNHAELHHIFGSIFLLWSHSVYWVWVWLLS